MQKRLDKKQFGPWAVITGASSGIGKEFARQIAASGINLVLVARREDLLKEAGVEFNKRYGVEYRVVVLDLSREDFIGQLASATDDLDIGLVISNAGTGSPGRFLTNDRDKMASLLRLNTLAHMDVAHHFGKKITTRRRGGFLFVGAMGAEKGIPYMANDSGAKSYVHSFAGSMHAEWKSLGVNVTVVAPGFTDTPVLTKFGLSPEILPMKPMTVEACVSEGLEALQKNRSMIVPGRMNRMMNALVPDPITRIMMEKILRKTLVPQPQLVPSGGKEKINYPSNRR
jgi:short-subunit dehydrogenase